MRATYADDKDFPRRDFNISCVLDSTITPTHIHTPPTHPPRTKKNDWRRHRRMERERWRDLKYIYKHNGSRQLEWVTPCILGVLLWYHWYHSRWFVLIHLRELMCHQTLGWNSNSLWKPWKVGGCFPPHNHFPKFLFLPLKHCPEKQEISFFLQGTFY